MNTPVKMATPSAPKRCKRKLVEGRSLEDLVEKMEALMTGETPKNVPSEKRKRTVRKKLF